MQEGMGQILRIAPILESPKALYIKELQAFSFECRLSDILVHTVVLLQLLQLF